MPPKKKRSLVVEVANKRSKSTSAPTEIVSPRTAVLHRTNTKQVSFEEVYPEGVQLNQSVRTLASRLKKRAATFDELTLSDLPVEFHPNDVKLRSYITRKIFLKSMGLLSAAMDTVTESKLALAMAKMGGMGIIHNRMPADIQAAQVKWVRTKINYGGMIEDPVTFLDSDNVSKFQATIRQNNFTFTSFPIVDRANKLVGMITRDMLDFVEDSNPPLSEVMIPLNKLTYKKEADGTITNSESAYKNMKEAQVKKLPVVDEHLILKGLYVWNDVKDDQQKKELFSLDEEGHFLVGAQIGTGPEELERARKLVEVGCKVLFLGSGHAAERDLKSQIMLLRQEFGDSTEIIVGNVASYNSAKYLLEGEYKPDALKVGLGCGRTSVSRARTGHGVPQATSLLEVLRAVNEVGKATGHYLPVIADGGIRTSGDIVKCMALGATGVMLGSMLGACEESPAPLLTRGGRKFKRIRGMASSQARAKKEDIAKNAEWDEGVEGLVLYAGSVENVINKLRGGVQSGMAHSGSLNVHEFQVKADVWMQSFAGIAEGKPHDLTDVQD